MSFRLPRLRRFSVRVLALLLGLLFAALVTTYLLVSRFNAANAHEHAIANLEVAARVFDDATRQRIAFFSHSADLMARDDTFKQVRRNSDALTLASLLDSYVERIGAPVIAVYDARAAFVASSGTRLSSVDEARFRELIRIAAAAEDERASSYAWLGEVLHLLVAIPVYSPFPHITEWVGLAFPIDPAFAESIKSTSRVEMTFVSNASASAPRALASTLSGPAAESVARASLDHDPLPRELALPDGRHIALFRPVPLLDGGAVTVVLQRPLAGDLARAAELQNYFLLISLGALAIATLFALGISRNVSQPVLQLAAHTRHIAAGDYARRIDLHRADELGDLATAFNDMSAGLAERDRVRDLLDKNVSPEVAAQLLRDGAALGGEEREVTILFADLRGFTTLSEQLAPRDLLNLLNRYLDRMSAEIERQGGVIDKFIGDAIMALFGAPVAQGDAAARALAAALAMERALAELNRELAAEGIAPLGIGIGVNTARVVAGNIGSHRRLNYSVIGDGVNVASRLQSLTRTAEYKTNVIASAATLAACRPPQSPSSDLPSPKFRPLGQVVVKGRIEPVEIFAVEEPKH